MTDNSLVTRASKLFVWVFGIIYPSKLRNEVTALVALGSVSGVAIALASKTLLKILALSSSLSINLSN